MPRSPHPVLAALLATSVVVTLALGVFAWKLARSEAALAAEQRASQADAQADALAAGFRQRLAEADASLSAWLGRPVGDPPALEGIVVVTWRDGRVHVAPTGALPFLPETPPPPPAPTIFDQAELLESAYGRPLDAAALYRQWTRASDETTRAGAWLRLGRSLRRADRGADARAAFGELARLGHVRLDVTGLPAELVGLAEQARLLDEAGDTADARAIRRQIVDGLDAGRWAVDKASAEYYLDAAGGSRQSGSWSLAEAAAAAWTAGDARRIPRGRTFCSSETGGVVTIWRSSGANAAMAIAPVAALLEPLVADGIAWRLTRAGQPIAGRANPSPPWAPAPRLIDDGENVELASWRIDGAAAAGSSSLIVSLSAATIVFLWAATYFVARAIRREAAVARLQSDFVSAVSHEFRSPLTTIRQMSEMLLAGRVERDDRRREYYGVLAAEATRLQRLVETLLNLGRIEAGRERYEMRDLDVATAIESAVTDVSPLAQTSRCAIERTPPAGPLIVSADEDALRLAVRNLLENAIRYSPGQPAVWVRWRAEGDEAVVEVADRGLGIDAAERDAIFGKFVRGRAAATANAKGTGVGLAMVRHVAMAHGGMVGVDSAAGETTFTLRLPLSTRPALEVPA